MVLTSMIGEEIVMTMIRKKTKKIPYNEIFGKHRLKYGKPANDEEAQLEDDQVCYVVEPWD